MNPVENYILKRSPEQRDVMLFFNELLTQKYQLSVSLKWGVPVYKARQMVFYLNPDKKLGGVHLCFYHGIALAKDHSILDTKGRKLVSSVHIPHLEKMDVLAIEACIIDALEREKHREKFFTK